MLLLQLKIEKPNVVIIKCQKNIDYCLFILINIIKHPSILKRVLIQTEYLVTILLSKLWGHLLSSMVNISIEMNSISKSDKSSHTACAMLVQIKKRLKFSL